MVAIIYNFYSLQISPRIGSSPNQGIFPALLLQMRKVPFADSVPLGCLQDQRFVIMGMGPAGVGIGGDIRSVLAAAARGAGDPAAHLRGDSGWVAHGGHSGPRTTADTIWAAGREHFGTACALPSLLLKTSALFSDII